MKIIYTLGQATINPSSVNGGVTEILIPVCGLPSEIVSGTVQATKLSLSMPGTVDDLDIVLTNPDHTGDVNLSMKGGGATGSDFIDTEFNRTSTTALPSGTTPYTGEFDNNWYNSPGFDCLVGGQANGVWKLIITNYGNDTGTLYNLSLTFEV